MNLRHIVRKAVLVEYIQAHGPIKTVRVSSAMAKGYAKRYRYWGATRYVLRLGKAKNAGVLVNMPTERAASDRRVFRLAMEDANALAVAEDRIHLTRIGTLTAIEVEHIYDVLAERKLV